MTNFSAHQHEVSCNNLGGAVADMIKALAPLVEIATELVQVPSTVTKMDIGRPLHIRRPHDLQDQSGRTANVKKLNLACTRNDPKII